MRTQRFLIRPRFHPEPFLNQLLPIGFRFVLGMGVCRFIIIALVAAISCSVQAEPPAQAHPPFAFTPSPGWQKDDDFKRAQEAWFDRNSKATLTIQSTVGGENFIIESSGVDEAIKLLTKVRRLATEFIGIEDWKISEYKLEKRSSGQILKLVGSYNGPGGHPVRFHEWQYFSGKRYYQITYADEEKGSRSEPEILKILSGFAPEGWIAEATTEHSWLLKNAFAESQGTPCAQCGVVDPTKQNKPLDLKKYIPPTPEILTEREIEDLETRHALRLGCKPDRTGGEISGETLVLCIGEIIKGFTAAVWDDLTSFSLFGGTDFVKTWWKTGSAGEAFQEWKHNQVNVISKLKDTFKKLWPTLKQYAAKTVSEWKCMTPEERTLLLCKSGAYVVTHGVLITTSGGALGVAYSAAKAGKIGAVGLKIVEGINKAKKAVIIGKTAKRLESVERLDKGYELLVNVARKVSPMEVAIVAEQAAVRGVAGLVKLSEEQWVGDVHVTTDGKVFLRKGAEIFRVGDEKLRKLAIKRWKEFHSR